MSIEVAFRVTGPIDALDRAWLVVRRGGWPRFGRAVGAGLPLAVVLIGIWYAERVEGLRGLRPLFGLAVALAWFARAVMLAAVARGDVRALFPGLPMPERAGRLLDVTRTAGVVGLGMAFWGIGLALSTRAGFVGVLAILPLLCARGAIAPSWIARAGCADRGGWRAFVASVRDSRDRRLTGLVTELLVLIALLALAGNVYGVSAFGVLVARVFLALDVASVDTFLSLRNVLVQMVVFASAALFLEPLRAALSAVWLVDARVRAEGLDLRAAVELAITSAGRTRSAQKDGATTERAGIAAVLALATLSLAAVGHAQDGPPTHPPHGPDAQLQVEGEGGENSGTNDPADEAVREKVHRILEQPEFREFDDGSRGGHHVDDWLGRLLEWLVRWLRAHPNDDTSIGPAIPLPPVWLFVTLAVLLVVVVAAYLLAARIREKRAADGGPGAPAASLDVREKAPDVLLDEASALAARGELRLALRSLYLATLVALDRRRLIDFDPHRTNWQYLRKMPRGPARDLFTDFTRLFDHKWYGDEPVSPIEYETARTLAVRIVETTAVVETVAA